MLEIGSLVLGNGTYLLSYGIPGIYPCSRVAKYTDILRLVDR